jgi:hypothetical protein
MTAAAESAIIEVHLGERSQLLDSLDPSPIPERDLNPRVEAFIVESARELGSGVSGVLVSFDQSSGLSGEERVIADAIHSHFARRSAFLRRDLRRLLHRGVISFSIAVTFLATLFIISQAVRRMIGETGFGSLLRESLLIVGWVAMWRPLEIFLYDWWPIASERRLQDRLSRMSVRVVYRDSGGTR